MSAYSGPEVANDGLVLTLDAVSQKSNGNNLVNTHNLTAAQWGVANNIITATNEVISPINTPVFKMTATGAGTTYLVQGYQSFSKTSSWTSSVYVRGGTYNFVRLSPSIASNADGIVLNLTTGAVVRVPYTVGYPTFTVSPESNGWFRISRTVQNDSYTLKCFALYMTSYLGNADVGAGQAGQFPANGEFIYVTAPQFEHTTSPRPYVQNNTTTRNWKDITSLNNEAVLVNGADFASTTNSDIAMSFDGVDDRIECGNFSVQYLTLSTWVYKTSSATNQGICRKETGWAVSQYNGTLQVAPGTSWTFYNTNYTIPLNTWVNIVYTYSGSGTTGSQIVYINGSSIYSTAAGSGAIGANGNAVRIGFDDNDWFWGGRISKTQIYNRVLSAAEIRRNFNALRGRFNI